MKLIRISFAVIVLASTSYVSGQGLPNLSGSWKLAQSSNQVRSAGLSEETLTIEHFEPQINVLISRRSNGHEDTVRQVFFSDGRGESNPTFESQTLQSNTRWSGRKLEVTRIDSITIAGPNGESMNVKLKVVRKWELSKDGNTLTITTSVSGPPGSTLQNAAGPGPAKDTYTKVDV